MVYGLGSENQNLPAYVVLDDPLGLPVNGVENWQAGFPAAALPGDAVPLDRLARAEPASPTATGRRTSSQTRTRPAHRGSTTCTSAQRPGQPDLDARIASYELAARMQLAATDALDLSRGTARRCRRCTASAASRPTRTAGAA